MKREKYPEKIPFRLTRMLVQAMEVSGLEGHFRLTCEAVMSVLREHSAGLMAVLEAFVHDPLINWSLLVTTQPQPQAAQPQPQSQLPSDAAVCAAPRELNADPSMEQDTFGSSIGRPHRRSTASSHAAVHARLGEEEAAEVRMPEELNQRALAVIRRIKDKLSGNDFPNRTALSVEAQVELLIQESSAVENLCQCYVGWCPFW